MKSDDHHEAAQDLSLGTVQRHDENGFSKMDEESLAEEERSEPNEDGNH